MTPSFSPLRYPGGKSQFYDSVTNILDRNKLQNIVYCEPFAGGAGVALRLLAEGRASKIIINDADVAIYSFWYEVVFDTEWLIERIATIPINLDMWQIQKNILNNPCSTTRELGLAVLYLNRTNRSGILKAGPIGGKEQTGSYKMDCRFNRDSLIRKINKIAIFKNRIIIENLDAEDFIKKYAHLENAFWFIDPPYYVKGSELYKNFYIHENHLSLEKCIKHYLIDKKWLLTYDNCPQIMEIYKWAPSLTFDLKYSVQVKRIEKELLFWNNLRVDERMLCKYE